MLSKNILSETWFDPRLALGPSPIHGKGLFATELIGAGEVVMIWGGDLYTEAELRAGKLPPGKWSYSIIEEGVYLMAPEDGLDYFVNHSCDPTAWMRDEVTVVARRDIQPGEEICGDYVVWEADPDYLLEPCRCGSPNCRTTITGNDWMRPELRERYQGHFLPCIERRIAREREEA
jgi:SET domain-containing protein